MRYSLYNVVWYDGENAFVTKMILSSDRMEAIGQAQNYIERGNGEVLKADRQETLDKDSIAHYIKFADEPTTDGRIGQQFIDMFL